VINCRWLENPSYAIGTTCSNNVELYLAPNVFNVILTTDSDYLLCNINRMVFIMEICVLCEGQTKFLYCLDERYIS
jgi:hypothetical protein